MKEKLAKLYFEILPSPIGIGAAETYPTKATRQRKIFKIFEFIFVRSFSFRRGDTQRHSDVLHSTSAIYNQSGSGIQSMILFAGSDIGWQGNTIHNNPINIYDLNV